MIDSIFNVLEEGLSMMILTTYPSDRTYLCLPFIDYIAAASENRRARMNPYSMAMLAIE
jgi:hypothetical protein